MTLTKANWQYRGLGLPSGVGLTRPVRRNPKPVAQALKQPDKRILLVGDSLATALAPLLKKALEGSGILMDGPVVSKPLNLVSEPRVVFAFGRAPAGAPGRAWQIPIAKIYRSPGARLLWLDASGDSLLDSKHLRDAARASGVNVVKPSEKVLRRAPNGVISAVGVAGLAGLVATWAKHQFSDSNKK